MAELKDFLANLAIDPRALGAFIHDPEGAMTAAKLSEDDKAAIKSGFPTLIYLRLAGVSLEEAFKITLRPPGVPQQFAFPAQLQQALPYGYQLPPQFIYPQPWPAFSVMPLSVSPMIMMPPQFMYPMYPTLPLAMIPPPQAQYGYPPWWR